ncbi:MAG: hypothetical protein HFG19_00440 [Oscillospiraceae bacterium]|nr:hypothetical protein [Oscillospiraceae bacterium]
MALKLFNKFVVFVTMSLLVLLTFALSVSAAEIDQERVDSLDSDIVIAYEIPGNPEKIDYIGVIPDMVPCLAYIEPDEINLYDREQMDYNVQSYFRAILKMYKIPAPDSYSYTVIYKTDLQKSYSDIIYNSYTKKSLT